MFLPYSLERMKLVTVPLVGQLNKHTAASTIQAKKQPVGENAFGLRDWIRNLLGSSTSYGSCGGAPCEKATGQLEKVTWTASLGNPVN